ncbi:MAG: type I glyceraldehyde-3-phosphate dehydrogenase [Ardenticatenaceae bacterium]|nr:type I glyceraldehyde-3-phosphate dehydrogenase [Ardenticatenaceae bacterium]MCB8987826.1 type I glyceraldehyde-3-phosphate dehydrogenase [Ardenticatenaceae bacterium]
MANTVKVGINGLGRIGRAAFKVILNTPELEVVGANDLIDNENLAYLLKYDTVYGRFPGTVDYNDNGLVVDGQEYPVSHIKDPAELPWGDLGAELVFECTGVFTKRADLEKHIQAGARRVILSAPTKSEEILTVVHGASDNNQNEQIISCASCTTNCITPVIEILGRRVGLKKAMLTTIHAYTATQSIVDGPNKKMRRGRAGAENFVPTSTGAAIATTKALPQYEGLFDGVAIRAPIPVGSIADIVLLTTRKTTVEEINNIFREEANSDRYRNVVAVSDEELVSSDIVQDPHASIVDLGMTQVVDGDLVKVMSWYDNEWGYVNQMVREAVSMTQASRTQKEAVR